MSSKTHETEAVAPPSVGGTASRAPGASRNGQSALGVPPWTRGFESFGLSERTLSILEDRRRTAVVRRRGWLVRRMLFLADLLGTALAVLVVQLLGWQSGLFLLSIPIILVLAKLYGMYGRDEERANHTTVDDVAGVFHIFTVGSFLLIPVGLALQVPVNPESITLFWALGITFVISLRVAGRAVARRSVSYLQNTVILGAGDIGQLIARKILQHPEYGINLVGFVDANPRAPRDDLGGLTILGSMEELPAIVQVLDVERLVVAFSGESNEDTLSLVRALRDYPIQIDIVPRLFEAVGPSADIHTIEGLPLVGLQSVRITRTSRWLKRGIDLLIAVPLFVLLSPLLIFIVVRVRRDSPGPAIFRQERLGLNMRPFTIFKFRTMNVDVNDSVHRDYVRATMDPHAPPTASGLYKLSREDSITPVGRWLRRTSLDELPQLVNVIKGEMSLVGPRPCLAYETEWFAPHHFERFLVPQGITGLWQVEGRALMTPREALDLDVAYARGWSVGLDLSLLLRTIRPVFSRNGAA